MSASFLSLSGRKFARLACCAALSLLAAGSLAACNTGGGSNDQVKLVVTPVPSPTATEAAQPTAAPVTYVVKPGDTLSGIADLFGVSVDDIVRINNITDPNALQVGQVLVIPGRVPTRTPGPSGTGTPGTPAVQPSGTITSTLVPGTVTPGGTRTPVLPPPNVTPPLGPTDVPQVPNGSPTASP